MVRVLFEEEERLTRFTQECILNCFHIELNLSWWDWIEMNMDFGWIDMVMKVHDSLWKWTFTFHLLLFKELLFYWLNEWWIWHVISTFMSLPLNTLSIIIEYYQLFYMFNISSIRHGFEVMIMFSTICQIWSGIQFFINQFIQIKYYLNKCEKMIVHLQDVWIIG